MEKVIENVNSWKKKISVKIPAEEIKKEVDEKLKEYAKTIQLPGFRKGKVPVSLVKKKYGKAIEAEVIEVKINNALKEIYREENLNPIYEHPIKEEDFSYDENKGLEFTIYIEVEPDLKIENYKGHGIKVEEVEVSDEEVEKEIELKLKTLAEFEDKGDDAVVEEGDYVIIDYEAISEENSDPKKDYRVHVIKNKEGKFDKFVEALLGKKKGDEYDLEYTFPEDYYVKEIAGKNVTFRVKVKKIEVEKIPELNDEVAKKLGYENVEDMKNKIKEEIKKRKLKKKEEEAFEKILDYILENNEVEAPESMILNYLYSEYQKLKQYNPNLDFEEYKKEAYEKAEKEVKKYLVINAIAKENNIKATSKEVDERIKEIADLYGVKFEELKEQYRKSGDTLRIREDIKIDKTFKFLLEVA